MQRYTIMVDAGYLLAQVVHVMSNGQSKKRAGLTIHDPVGIITTIQNEAAGLLDLKGKELLRIYWYDGAGSRGLTPEQKRVKCMADVQFRAGTMNSSGQQKGVDTLLVLDIVELAANQAISDAMIITGDADFAAGIELAQSRGVRIAVLGVPDNSGRHNQSPEVLDRADRVGLANRYLFTRHCQYTQPAAPSASSTVPVSANRQPSSTTHPLQTIKQAVATFVAQASVDGNTIDHATGQIEHQMDSQLIFAVFKAIGRVLTPEEKKEARREFKALLTKSAPVATQPI